MNLAFKASPLDDNLRNLLQSRDPAFWTLLRLESEQSTTFQQLFFLSRLRRKAESLDFFPPVAQRELRIAILGGYSLFPFHEIVEHFLAMAGYCSKVFIGDYDNDSAEILDENSLLYTHQPKFIILLPKLRSLGSFSIMDRPSTVRNFAEAEVDLLLQRCRIAHERSSAEIVLGNFILPSAIDPGMIRSKRMGSAWTYLKYINLELGLRSPEYVQICDLEFLSARCGTQNVSDDRAWYETKQPFSLQFIPDVAREVLTIISAYHAPHKKVLVLDLDNTLWGGVVGDDGLEGIELGDVSARGQAFKSFQQFIRTLSERGIVLAVCSKNEPEIVMQVFEEHPEMVLSREDIAIFLVNWQPKSDNIREIAAELNLGLDSVVFVDDNPAEIEIVRQFVPEVTCLLLDKDPSTFIQLVQNSRCFEPLQLTDEDAVRGKQYQQEFRRKELLSCSTDMTTYLMSLSMCASIGTFCKVDIPRITQLINKSNQFNLTTRRRSEGEVKNVAESSGYRGMTVRLDDRFGSHGLVGVVIAQINGSKLIVDTFVMSCRVLKRQVEHEIINELVSCARLESCETIIGVYIPTLKNGMVANLYPSLGFVETESAIDDAPPGSKIYELSVSTFEPFLTTIQTSRRV